MNQLGRPPLRLLRARFPCRGQLPGALVQSLYEIEKEAMLRLSSGNNPEVLQWLKRSRSRILRTAGSAGHAVDRALDPLFLAVHAELGTQDQVVGRLLRHLRRRSKNPLRATHFIRASELLQKPKVDERLRRFLRGVGARVVHENGTPGEMLLFNRRINRGVRASSFVSLPSVAVGRQRRRQFWREVGQSRSELLVKSAELGWVKFNAKSHRLEADVLHECHSSFERRAVQRQFSTDRLIAACEAEVGWKLFERLIAQVDRLGFSGFAHRKLVAGAIAIWSTRTGKQYAVAARRLSALELRLASRARAAQNGAAW